MMVREKGDIKPIILNFGVALAFSLAGFLYSRLRIRRTKPSTTLPSERPSDYGSGVNFGGGRDQREDDLHAVKAASSSCDTVSDGHILGKEETCINKVIVDSSSIGLSPCCKQSGEKDEFLLPEFNDLEKELDFGAIIVGNSFNKDTETPRSKVECPKAYVSPQKDDYEQEIRHLRRMIRMLQERESSLEVQLLEYCGLREQETAVIELQNRLKISNMEAKMFNLKVDTLQSENRQLEAQVADHAKVVAELEAAKAKVKLLKEKIRCEAQHNRERIITLQQKVAKLQDQECKVAASDLDVQKKLQKLKDLESEAEALRKSNLRLHVDNSDLARRLNSSQILANAVQEDPEADVLKEESERLRQENEDLVKEIERLQADQCLDIEELVYLRWINACLRYELRNHQPPPGKTVARDLSKSLSPTSEKKAKQLILEYANADGIGEEGVSIVDFDSDQWSSSQGSFLTDSEECDDYSSVDNSSAARTNTSSKVKVFSKLRRLLRSKDSHHHHNQVTSGEKSRSQEDCSNARLSLNISTGNEAGAGGRRREFATSTRTSRTSFESHRMTSLKEEYGTNTNSIDMGSSKRFSLSRVGSGDSKNRLGHISDSLGMEKSELVKYAEALKDSDVEAKRKLRRRSVSYS